MDIPTTLLSRSKSARLLLKMHWLSLLVSTISSPLMLRPRKSNSSWLRQQPLIVATVSSGQHVSHILNVFRNRHWSPPTITNGHSTYADRFLNFTLLGMENYGCALRL